MPRSKFPVETVIKAIDRFTGPAKKIAATIKGPLTKAFKGLKKVAGLAGRGLKAVGKGALALGASATAGAFGVLKFADAHATSLDDLAKFSKRAGLTAQTYRELETAAGFAGASTGQFRAAMEKFTRVIGEAKAGSGALTTLLKKTNPAFLETIKNTKNQEEALDLMIRGMASLEDPTKRAALAAAAFGRAGQKMTLLVADGVEGFKKQREEARKYAGVIGDDALKAAESYKDTQLKLNKSIGAAKEAIGSKLLPVLEPMVQSIADWVSENRELIATNVTEFVKDLWEALKAIDWKEVWEGVKSVGSTVKDLIVILGKAGSIIGPLATVAIGIKMVGGLAGLKKAFLFVGMAASKVWALLLANPIVAVIAAVGAAVTAIILNWDEIVEYFSTWLEDFKWLLNEAGKALDALFVEPFRQAWKEIKFLVDNIETAAQALANVVTGDDVTVAEQRGREVVGAGEQFTKFETISGPSLESVIAAAKARDAAKAEVGGEVKITLQNAPPGTRVERVQSSNPAVPLAVNVGRRTVAQGAP